MKLAVIVTDPPWHPRTRWQLRSLLDAFPQCSLVTIERRGGASKAAKRIYRKHGPLKFFSRLAAAALYRRYTSRIDRKAREHFEPLVKDLQSPTPDVRFQSLEDGDFLDWLERAKPDVVVPIAGGLISSELLERCKWVRWHHGITPSIRGLAAPFWAIHDQRPDWLGITIQELGRKLDAGPILAQQRLAVNAGDDLATIHLRLDLAVGKHLVQALRAIEDGSSQPSLCRPEEGTYRSSPTLRALLAFPSHQRRFIRSFAA